jgi:hypothetical protein
MRGIFLRITIALLSITIVGNSLALLVGRFIPADMLTTTATITKTRGIVDAFLLIDLNRHLRISVPMPIAVPITTTVINWQGQNVLLMNIDSGRRLYTYNLITDTLRELDSTYIDGETNTIFGMDEIYTWSSNDNELWHIDRQNGAIYRLDVDANRLEQVIMLGDESNIVPRIGVYATLSRSSTGEQVALVDTDMIYIFNSDGSNLRQYPKPPSGTTPSVGWSPDERRLYLFWYGTLNSLQILDLDTGLINADIPVDLVGSSFSPCWQHDEWLAYVDTENEGYMLNIQTGEIENLSNLPEFAGQPIRSVYWFPNCEWAIVVMGGGNSLQITGNDRYQMYIVSRDGQTLFPLGEQVDVLYWINEDTFLLVEEQGATDNVYEVHFDGTVHQTRVGSLSTDGFVLNSLANDPYRLLIFELISQMGMVVNIRSGAVETYFAPDELADFSSFPVYWRWN